MMHSRLITAAWFATVFLSSPGRAQQTASSSASDASGNLEEIVVAARRRSETLLSSPVVVTALGADELDRRGITSMEDIARTVPSLVITNSSGDVQGGTVVLRGIGSADANQFSDQSVAFNIDGVQVARATPKRMSEFDLEQVEVLKGPQALYFGKNSPGGIIVINSADPTKDYEAHLSASYEAIGDEKREEGYVAGPITDTLGFRIAAFNDRLGGWSTNMATPSALYGPSPQSVPNDHEYGGRLTLKFEPSDAFNARLKFEAGNLDTEGAFENTQRVVCPLGAPQFGGPDDCTANDKVVRANYGPLVYGRFGAPFSEDGVPYLTQVQYLGGLDMNYNLPDSLVLSSQTGYYKNQTRVADDLNGTDTTLPARIVAAAFEFGIREISQEVRLTSNFTSPLNFMVGAFYQHDDMSYSSVGILNATSPSLISNYRVTQTGNAPSIFASLSYKPIEELEISGGARWSYEKKNFAAYNALTGALYNPALPSGTLKPQDSWHNLSPELTLAWRPTELLTVFASYKEGFLSGGYNSGNGNEGLDRSYNEETVKGFEAGVKSRLLDGTLRTDFDAWDYKIDGQQVASLLANFTSNVNNAAASRTYGAETHAGWTSPIAGLEFHGGITYTHARYLSYTNAPCFSGQTPAAGCNLDFNSAAGAYVAQNLSGAPLPRAANWGETLGASYSTNDALGNKYTLSVDGDGTSSFNTDTTNNANSIQKGYRLLDAALRLETRPGIELALIGKNLTNEYYFTRSVDEPLTGGRTGTATGFRADTQADVSRGREIIMRFSYRFN